MIENKKTDEGWWGANHSLPPFPHISSLLGEPGFRVDHDGRDGGHSGRTETEQRGLLVAGDAQTDGDDERGYGCVHRSAPHRIHDLLSLAPVIQFAHDADKSSSPVLLHFNQPVLRRPLS